LRSAVLVLFASMLLVATGRAVAHSGENPCRSIGTEETLRPIPQSLVPVAKRVFRLRVADQQVRRSTVFRRADGHILLCNYGANLPCGKANADHRLPQAEAWCRDHADTDFIPRYVLPTRLATSIIGAVPPAPQRSSHRSRPSTRAASSPDIGSRQSKSLTQKFAASRRMAWTPGNGLAVTDMGGDERRSLFAARRVPVALSAARSFPPRSTVYNIFSQVQRDGVLEPIWAELHMPLRERMGREVSPSAAVLDTQSIKSAERGGR